MEPGSQKRRIAVIASVFVMAVVTMAGVLTFFAPIAETDHATGEWHPAIALAVYSILSVLLFDWAANRTGSAMTAAAVIAGSQLIFILDLLARGERGVLTALAGSALVVITWTAVALVYRRIAPSPR